MRSDATRLVAAPDSEGCARSIGSESLCTRFLHGSRYVLVVRQKASSQKRMIRTEASMQIEKFSFGQITVEGMARISQADQS